MGFITDILKDLPVSAVMREKILQLEADVLRIKEEKAELEKQLADLKEKHLELLREREEYLASHEQFVEVKGMKFKRLDSGAYDETPYCINPLCHNAPMSLIKMMGGVAMCENYRRKVFISQSAIAAIVGKLNSPDMG